MADGKFLSAVLVLWQPVSYNVVLDRRIYYDVLAKTSFYSFVLAKDPFAFGARRTCVQ
jgi:hypothetical protein